MKYLVAVAMSSEAKDIANNVMESVAELESNMKKAPDTSIILQDVLDATSASSKFG